MPMNIVKARGTLKNPERFLTQDFEQLKQYCSARRVRFIDDMFPPDRRSIGSGLMDPASMSRVVWQRPTKLASNPCLVTDGISRFDFSQGVVGNCWFLVSVGAMTFQNGIFNQVVPEQNFDEDYCGIFHFRFWRFGSWFDVVIDDKLPTIDGRLIFVHSKDPNEFWPALLEKAYAKVCGSYADMNAGKPAEAMVDFTGGVHMCIDLKKPPGNLMELMIRAGRATSMMGCGTPQGETSANTVLPNGLVQGHAYTVTGVKQVTSQGLLVNLVRLYNPWGQGEWKGDWSDRSPLWTTVSPEDRDRCLSVKDDGEFWIKLEDFCMFYDDLDICCLCPDFLDANTSCHWKMTSHDGRWLAGRNAGGCMNNNDTFFTNPQYRVKIEELPSDCAPQQGDKNMLVSLMQKPDKRNRRLVQSLHIGFTIFEVPDEFKAHTRKFPDSFFKTHAPVAQTNTFLNTREVTEFLTLKPGEYLIVPSTFKPNETASFLLTIFSKSEAHIHDNSEDHDHRQDEELEPTENEEEVMKDIMRQYFDQNNELDDEQLQKVLNEIVLKGGLEFSIDACRSMVAQMDTSLSGKLNKEEFSRLWRRIITYKDIFLRSDASSTGRLSLRELKTATVAAGLRISDDLLNTIGLRYGGTSGEITLENFISLALRYKSMNQIFNQLSSGSMNMTIQESQWLYISMCF